MGSYIGGLKFGNSFGRNILTQSSLKLETFYKYGKIEVYKSPFIKLEPGQFASYAGNAMAATAGTGMSIVLNDDVASTMGDINLQYEFSIMDQTIVPSPQILNEATKSQVNRNIIIPEKAAKFESVPSPNL